MMLLEVGSHTIYHLIEREYASEDFFIVMDFSMEREDFFLCIIEICWICFSEESSILFVNEWMILISIGTYEEYLVLYFSEFFIIDMSQCLSSPFEDIDLCLELGEILQERVSTNTIRKIV